MQPLCYDYVKIESHALIILSHDQKYREFVYLLYEAILRATKAWDLIFT